MEEFRPCFETYEISNLGNCRKQLEDGTYKLIKGSVLNSGYRYFQVIRKGIRKNYFFHHLVSEQFIGIRPDGLIIDHKDRNKLNNCVDNLHYTTQLENSRNHHRIVEGIPFDENRHYNVCKKWRDDNVDAYKEHKKQYYQNNKIILAEKEKARGNIELECSLCKNIRTMSRSNYNITKRKNGLENNICRPCHSRNMLNKINHSREVARTAS
jgi:hypothetical protein